MSENYYDAEDPGCCLICPNAHEGCLCYECKCRQCSEYEPEGDYDEDGNEKGYCTLTRSTYSTPSRAEAIIAQILPDKKGFLKCPGCPCLFFTKADLIAHIRKYSVNTHEANWKKEHAKLDGNKEEEK